MVQNTVTSRHIMLCISGFLSEADTQQLDWQYLIDECRHRGVPLYYVCWQAKNQTELEDIVVNQSKQNLGSVMTNTSKLSDLFSMQNLGNIGKFIGSSFNQGAATFKNARENAKLTGKLLAHFLGAGRENSPLFGDHTFSLLGFSLGS